jgi:hypothetical protein
VIDKAAAPAALEHPRFERGLILPQYSSHSQEDNARSLIPQSHTAEFKNTISAKANALKAGKQSKRKWNTVKGKNAARAVDGPSECVDFLRLSDLSSHGVSVVAHSWIDGALRGKSPKLPTLEQVRTQMAEQDMNDACTACGN